MFEQLMDAINKGNIVVAQEIISKLNKETIEAKKGTEWLTALDTAANKNQSPVFHKLFAKVMHQVLGVKDSINKTVLHIAAGKSYDQIVTEILKHAPKLADAVDNNKLTPLHYQGKAENCSPKVVEGLLSKMSQRFIDSVTNTDDTALHYHGQIKNTNLEILKMLTNKMSKSAIDLVDKQGNTVLHYIAKHSTSQNIGEIFDLVFKAVNSSTINQTISGVSALNNLIENSQIEESIKSEVIKSFLIKMSHEAISNTIKAVNHDEQQMIKVKLDNVSYSDVSHASINSQYCNPHAHKLYHTAVIKLKKVENLTLLVICCDELIKENPNNAELYLKKSNIMFALNRHEEGQKCYEEAEKISASGNNQPNVILDNPDIKAAKIIDASKGESIYSADRIKKLVDMQVNSPQKPSIPIECIDVEKGELSDEAVQNLLNIVKEKGKLLVPIHLQGDKWAGMLISKNKDDEIKITYNDPSGKPYQKEKNVKALTRKLEDLNEEGGKTTDLKQNQQCTEADSGAAVVENLALMANAEPNQLKKSALQKILPMADEIKITVNKHALMDDNPWYSNDKLEKLLQVALKGKQVIIAPVTVFESKDLLVQNVETIAKEVMVKGVAGVVPLHIHGNHWTGLVIKKLPADCLQVMYNDPKGTSLVSEENSALLLTTIMKVNSDFRLIDLQRKQQINDDDCGPFTIENLLTLATADTRFCSKQELQVALLDSAGGEVADTIRKKHNYLLLNEVNISISSKDYETTALNDESNSSTLTGTSLENVIDYSKFTDLAGDTPHFDGQ